MSSLLYASRYIAGFAGFAYGSAHLALLTSKVNKEKAARTAHQVATADAQPQQVQAVTQAKKTSSAEDDDNIFNFEWKD